MNATTCYLLTTCIYYFLHTTWIKHTTSASRVPWWWLSVFNAGDDDDPLKLGPVDDPVHNVSKLLYGNIVPSLLLTIWPSLSAAPAPVTASHFSFLDPASNRFENILLRKIGGEQEHIRNNFDDLRDLRGKYCLCFDAEKTAEQSQQQKSSYIYLHFLDVSQLFAFVFSPQWRQGV